MCLTTAPHRWPWFEWCWCLTQNAAGSAFCGSVEVSTLSIWVDTLVTQVATISSRKTKNSKSNSEYFAKIYWDRLKEKLTIWVLAHWQDPTRTSSKRICSSDSVQEWPPHRILSDRSAKIMERFAITTAVGSSEFSAQLPRSWSGKPLDRWNGWVGGWKGGALFCQA